MEITMAKKQEVEYEVKCRKVGAHGCIAWRQVKSNPVVMLKQVEDAVLGKTKPSRAELQALLTFTWNEMLKQMDSSAKFCAMAESNEDLLRTYNQMHGVTDSEMEDEG
jgi:3'-phosphoadenosine 5'-phosphosulfate (PAPS) 3'-phosphatase